MRNLNAMRDNALRKLQVKTQLALRLFALHVLAASLASVNASAQTASVVAAASPVPFEEALELYDECKWSAAYERFAERADRGDAEAARIVLYMHRYGKTLYATNWYASQPQIDRWTRLAAQRMQALAMQASR